MPHACPAAKDGTGQASSAQCILHIVVDDLGYDDVGYHDPAFITPKIDRLRSCGIHLDAFYAFKTCAPSRASILAGRYPFSMGIYENADIDSAGTPTNFTLLPELLHRAGFATHAVGKWHVGFRTNAMAPTSRGFDSFIGTWHCCSDHYRYTFPGDHAVPEPVHALSRANQRGGSVTADFASVGAYSTEFYANESVRIIRSHRDPNRGLYLFLSFQAVHGPYQVPEQYAAKYNSRLRSGVHRQYAGMVSAVDAAVGQVVSASRDAHFGSRTLVVFHSDNGGVVGRNGRLRGGKFGLWEGGVRVTAFLGGPLLHGRHGEAGRVWRGLGHVSDLLPTLLSAAGVTLPDANDGSTGPTPLDGVSLWESIKANASSPRREVVHQVINEHNFRDCAGADHDAQNCGGAIQSGRWKLLVGYPGDARDASAKDDHRTYDKWELIKQHGGQNASAIPRLDGCHIFTGEGCPCWRGVCLYDVEADPGEQHEQSAQRPELVTVLLKRFEAVSAVAAERAALCGKTRTEDEHARRVAVRREHAYLPYASEQRPWLNDKNSQDARACRRYVVGSVPWWYRGQPMWPYSQQQR